MKIKVVCSWCGKEFDRERKFINLNQKRGHRTFCSSVCRAAGSKNGKDFECAACGKKFYRNPSRARRTQSGDLFCSKACSNGANNSLRAGENHPNYLNGIGGYRERAFRKYGKVCTVFGCGYAIEQILEVHHRDGNRDHNEEENLDVLCPTHHAEFGRGIRRY